MRVRHDADFLNDLEDFCRICAIFEKKAEAVSFARVAEELGMAASTLQTVRDRIEDDLGVQLFHSIPKSSKNYLTNSGRELYQYAKELIDRLHYIRRRPFGRNPVVRLISSHHLVSHVCPPVFRGFLEKQRAIDRDVTLRVVDHANIDQTIKSVTAGDVDFALVWHFKDRNETVEREKLTYYKFPNPYPLAVICGHHHRFAERVISGERDPVKLDELAGDTILLLHGNRQPLHDKMPIPTRQGERIVMDHFDSLIEFLRAGHKGVAIVPAFYADFDNYRKAGDLFAIPLAPVPGETDDSPVQPAELGIAAIFRGQLKKGEADKLANYFWPSKESPSGELLLQVDESLRENPPQRSGWDEPFETASITAAYDRLPEFRHLYYVWCDRVGIDRPVWKHVAIKFTELRNGRESDSVTQRKPASAWQGSFSFGTDAGEEWVAVADVPGKCKIIQMRAEEKNGERSVIGNFSMIHMESGSHLLIGMWMGKDGVGNPLAGPILLADADVGCKTLLRVARAAMLRVFFDIDCVTNVDAIGNGTSHSSSK